MLPPIELNSTELFSLFRCGTENISKAIAFRSFIIQIMEKASGIPDLNIQIKTRKNKLYLALVPLNVEIEYKESITNSIISLATRAMKEIETYFIELGNNRKDNRDRVNELEKCKLALMEATNSFRKESFSSISSNHLIGF